MGSFPHSPSLSSSCGPDRRSLFVTSLIIQYLVSGVGTHDLCTHIILSEPVYGLETMKGFSMQIPYSLFSWCEVDKSVKGREAHKPLPENTFVASNILPIGTVYLKSKEGRGRTAPPWCPASTATPRVFVTRQKICYLVHLPWARSLQKPGAEAAGVLKSAKRQLFFSFLMEILSSHCAYFLNIRRARSCTLADFGKSILSHYEMLIRQQLLTLAGCHSS